MPRSKRNGPSHFAAKVDIGLQSFAYHLNIRKEYYDLREKWRARTESAHLDDNKIINAIFIHIPKCGGTSVEKQIKIYHGHRSAVYFRKCDRHFFEKTFKFSLVRNPYDRLVSGFYYLKYHTKSPLNKQWVEHNIMPFSEFNDFAEALEDKEFGVKITSWRHFVPQWYFICDSNFRLMIDYVGKIEDFDSFITEVEQRSTVRLRNEVRRASERKPWQEHYSEKSKRIVAKLYKEDFRIFGYAE